MRIKAGALYRLDRLEEAPENYETMRQNGPRSLVAIGRLGIIAATTDGRSAADAWDSLMAGYTVEYGSKGQPSLWRAKIALALGDRDRGVHLDSPGYERRDQLLLIDIWRPAARRYRSRARVRVRAVRGPRRTETVASARHPLPFNRTTTEPPLLSVVHSSTR